MKAKDQAYYQKIVMSGQWKKVSKALTEGGQQEKEWVLETLGVAAARSDEGYNQLVSALQGATDKPTQLAAIKAMGVSGRSAAISQLEYMSAHTEDAEIQEALLQARHNIRSAK